MRPTALLLFIALQVLAGFTAPARADVEPAAYRVAIERAVDEFGLGNYEEAREQFQQAFALFPNARALRGLGMSEFELRNYVEAATALERALASDVRPLEGKQRDDTASLLARARAYVGQLRFDMKPKDARLSVDGVPKSLDASRALRLDVGKHALEFQAEGFASERREVSVRGGQSETVSVRLVPLGGAHATGEERGNADRAEPVPVYKRWWLWTIVGVVVAGAAAGTAIALTRANDEPTRYRGVASANTPVGFDLAPLVRR